MYTWEIINFLIEHNHVISKTQLENIKEDSPQILEVIDINEKKAIITNDLETPYEFELIDYTKIKSEEDMMNYCMKRNYRIGGEELRLASREYIPTLTQSGLIDPTPESKYGKYRFYFSNKSYHYDVNLMSYDEACKDLRVKDKTMQKIKAEI